MTILKKQFKSESKKLMDMMINSIYTHKEIFLREIISNASDAIDKRHFISLTNPAVGLKKSEYKILIKLDKENRIISVTDNGCGMTEKELENNLGTIAKSGSGEFKAENEQKKNVNIIGQFGVGFYSAFMVSDSVTVKTKSINSEKAYTFASNGTDGYTITENENSENDLAGTTVTMHIRPDTENENYSEFLDIYKIRSLIKKYSDYIRYPIIANVPKSKLKEGTENEYIDYEEPETLNSMVPLWKREKSKIKPETYNEFYKNKFADYTDPLKVIHYKTEGSATYSALLFIPKHPPFDFYTKNYQKGLALYSKGVLIMEKCAELLPDYFSFVKGVVDSEDLSLNISREMLQHDGQLKLIAKTLEKKIKNELQKMLENDRENYEEFFKAFGVNLKFGVYNDYGIHKEELKDLLLFNSSNGEKPCTLNEYVLRADNDTIYYACGETKEKIEMLPQCDAVKSKGYEVLYLTDDIDEFAVKVLNEYNGKKFKNVCDNDLDLVSEEDKKLEEAENEKYKDLLEEIKNIVGDISKAKFTKALKDHPVCLTTEGGISLEMEKVLKSMPGADKNQFNANLVFEINSNHKIKDTLINAYNTDKSLFGDYVKLLYDEAALISGKPLKNPSLHTDILCKLITK